VILSVDPGKHVGWALWNSAGRLLDHGIVEIDEFKILLRHNHFKTPSDIVYEDFRLQKFRAERQSQSRMEASQVIGMLKLYGSIVGARVVAQELEARDLGYMHSGLEPSKNHDHSHDLDAIAHGYYFLESVGIQPHALVD
jgi:hypothetical protein